MYAGFEWSGPNLNLPKGEIAKKSTKSTKIATLNIYSQPNFSATKFFVELNTLLASSGLIIAKSTKSIMNNTEGINTGFKIVVLGLLFIFFLV